MEVKSVLPHYSPDINNDSELSTLEGLTTARIENLSDGVFSIAMTLLVLDLKLPVDVKLTHLTQIVDTIGPQLLSYILSFVVLGSLWLSHHNQFHWIEISNRKFLWINIFFLCFIGLIPFSTILLRAHEFEPIAIVIYGLNILTCLFFLYLNWVYAAHKHRLVIATLSTRTMHIIELRILFIMGLYALGLALAFIAPIISLLTFIIVQIIFIVPARYILQIAAKMKE